MQCSRSRRGMGAGRQTGCGMRASGCDEATAGGWPGRGQNSVPRQPSAVAAPDSAGHMRPVAGSKPFRALPCRGPRACELRQSCPDTAGGQVLLTPASGESGRGIGAGGVPAASRFRAPKRPSGPQGRRPEPGPQVEACRGWRPIGGLRGVVPPGETASLWRRRLKGAEDRATPGGYGGKPPGVAIIGVPTGARNAGRCSDGGPEHRFECYYDSPRDASNPEHNRVVCACSAALLNVVGTPDVYAL